MSVLIPEEHLKDAETVEEFIKQEVSPVFEETEQEELIRMLIRLMEKSRIVAYGAHSALCLLTRITRNEGASAQFVREGGVEALLQVYLHSFCLQSLKETKQLFFYCHLLLIPFSFLFLPLESFFVSKQDTYAKVSC